LETDCTGRAALKLTLCPRYHNLLNQAYVADSPSLRWCPHARCDHIIECKTPRRMLNNLVPTVTCNCGRDLCFGCGFADNHRPVLCKIVRMWEKKCQSTIEKNGGCK
jgi:ariadne-1